MECIRDHPSRAWRRLRPDGTLDLSNGCNPRVAHGAGQRGEVVRMYAWLWRPDVEASSPDSTPFPRNADSARIGGGS
jgi:hypothetical protein